MLYVIVLVYHQVSHVRLQHPNRPLTANQGNDSDQNPPSCVL